MSDRLIEAYLKKEDRRIQEAVRRRNHKHLSRMAKAGREFKLRHPELYASR